MSWLLSFLPRKWLQDALLDQWARSLPREERIRLYHFGATGNQAHHLFQWADDIPAAQAALNHGGTQG